MKARAAYTSKGKPRAHPSNATRHPGRGAIACFEWCIARGVLGNRPATTAFHSEDQPTPDLATDNSLPRANQSTNRPRTAGAIMMFSSQCPRSSRLLSARRRRPKHCACRWIPRLLACLPQRSVRPKQPAILSSPSSSASSVHWHALD